MITARLACLVGAACGAGLALVGLLWPEATLQSSQPVIARVNGHDILQSDLDRALAAIAADSRNALPADAAPYALGRLIDEELLYQRAIELDLPRNAATIRRSVVLSMIDAILAEAVTAPTEAELRALYDAEASVFTPEASLRIAWTSGAIDGAEMGRPAAHPPDRLLGATELRRYLGEALTDLALGLDVGEISDPVELGGRRHRIEILERVAGERPDFDAQRDAVTALWRERAEAQALEAYLEGLRSRADLQYRQP